MLVHVFWRMLRMFLGAFGALVLLFVTVDALHRVGVVTEKEGVVGLLRYGVSAVPQSLWLVVPLAVLAAVLFVWFRMERDKETVALKAAGVPIYHLFAPMFGLCFVGAVVLFLGGEVAGSYAEDVVRRMRRDRSLKRVAVWDNTLGLVRCVRYFPATRSMLYIRVLRFDAEGRLRERYSARGGHLEPRRLVLKKASLLRFGEDGRPLGKPVWFKRLVLRTGIKPVDFEAQDKDAHFRTLFSLAHLSRRYPHMHHLSVQFYGHIALLFAPFVLCVCGVPFSLWMGRRGVARGAAAALVVAFAYLGLTMFLWEVGGRGQLSAVTAAWTPNLLFVALGASVIDLIHT